MLILNNHFEGRPLILIALPPSFSCRVTVCGCSLFGCQLFASSSNGCNKFNTLSLPSPHHLPQIIVIFNPRQRYISALLPLHFFDLTQYFVIQSMCCGLACLFYLFLVVMRCFSPFRTLAREAHIYSQFKCVIEHPS